MGRTTIVLLLPSSMMFSANQVLKIANLETASSRSVCLILLDRSLTTVLDVKVQAKEVFSYH